MKGLFDRSRKLSQKILQNKIRLVFLCCLTGFFFSNSHISGQDEFITIKSNETIQIDKAKGNAILKGGVEVVQESTKSFLKSELVEIKRDNASRKIVLIKAKGKVQGTFNQINPETKVVRTVFLICKAAELDRNLNRATLRGGVKVTSHDFELTADSVDYDLRQELGTMTEIPGKQVKFILKKNTNSKTNAPESANVTPEVIEGFADELRVNRSAKKMTLQGKIKIHDKSEEAEFSGNRADIYLDDNEKLQRIVAYQNVVISQPNRLSQADRAVFDYRSDSITLTGNASVKEKNQMEMNAPRITLHMDEDMGFISGGDKTPVKGKVNISP